MGALSNIAFTAVKITTLVPIILAVWTLLIGGSVKDLDLQIPFSDIVIPLQTPLELIADTMASIINLMPWFEVIYNLFIAGIVIKFMLILFELFWKVITLLFSS